MRAVARCTGVGGSRERISGMRPLRSLLLAAGALAVAAPLLPSQTPDPLTLEVRAWHRAHALPVLREFREFLSLPNVASDSVHALAEGRGAFERLESGAQFGKVVLRVSDG